MSQYNKYCDIHESLIVKGHKKNIDEIELLELLIQDYDQKLLKEKSEELNPVELLRSLMTDANMSQTTLATSINVSRQLISDVLHYRRNISKDMMTKLANFFSMSLEAFSRSYTLNPDKTKKIKEVKVIKDSMPVGVQEIKSTYKKTGKKKTTKVSAANPKNP